MHALRSPRNPLKPEKWTSPPPAAKVPTVQRFKPLARFIKSARLQRDLGSTRALAKAAGMSHSYVATIERAEIRPGWKTAERLMKALRLAPEERDEFARLWAAAGTPKAVEESTRGVNFPQILRWRHAPACLLDLPHSMPPTAYADPDQVLQDVVTAVDALLGWAAVATGRAPSLDDMRAAVETARAEAHGPTPSFVGNEMPAEWREGICVQRAIVHRVRAHLFSSAADTRATTGMLAGWAYVPRAGQHPRDALHARFQDKNLDAALSVAGIDPQEIAALHAELIVAHYWHGLQLLDVLGDQAATGWCALSPGRECLLATRGLLSLDLSEAASRLYPAGDAQPADGQAFDDLAHQCRHARFHARVFDQPRAAESLLLLPASAKAPLLEKIAELERVLAPPATEFGVEVYGDPLSGLAAKPRPRRARAARQRGR